MALYTDFFFATEDELRRAFVGWRRPARDRVERQLRNPFTGKPIAALVWIADPADDGAVEPFPGKTLGERVGALRPHAVNNLDPLLLGDLVATVLGDESWRERFVRDDDAPPLVAPESEAAIQLVALPDAFVDAMGAASEPELDRVAEAWSQSETASWSQQDCRAVLDDLRSYVRSHRGENKRLYHYT